MQTFSCGAMRAKSRAMISSNFKTVIAATAIYIALTQLVQLVPFGVGYLWIIVTSGVFAFGYISFIHNSITGIPVAATDVIDFRNFGKKLGLFWFIALFVFLWSLLLVVPGIIAAIRYSQSFFILKEHPEYGIRQCVNESKKMMKGNKGNYFIMMLSFIGWFALAAVVYYALFRVITGMLHLSIVDFFPTNFNPAPTITITTGISSYAYKISYGTFITCTVLFGAVELFIMPYIAGACAAFYEFFKQDNSTINDNYRYNVVDNNRDTSSEMKTQNIDIDVQLRKCRDMYNQGIINEEEFERMKRKLLSM